MFYNTQSEKGEVLKEAIKSNNKQERRILMLLNLYQESYLKLLTPHRLRFLYMKTFQGYKGTWSQYMEGCKYISIGSIKRALCDLIDMDSVIVAGKKKEFLGRINNVYETKDNERIKRN